MSGIEDVRIAAHGGTRLHAQRAGSGAPVLFVHGSASDHRTWDGAFAAVAGRFRPIAYSRRGHHPNPPPPEGEYRFEDQLDDLLAVIEGLGSDKVSLVGHSSGGVIALLAAARSPAVRRLVLSEPPCFTLYVGDPPGPGEIAGLMLRDPRLAAGLIRFGATALAPAKRAARRGDRQAALRHFGQGVLGRAAFRRLSEARRQQAERNFFTAEVIGPAFPRIDPGEVARVTCPTLVVAGAESPGFQQILARRLAAALPRAELLVIPAASHIVHEDAPEAFERALVAFLEQDD